MTIAKDSIVAHFLTMADGEVLTPEQAAAFNSKLATTPSSDLSVEQGRQVADYLTVALNINSVDPILTTELEGLLSALQNRNQ